MIIRGIVSLWWEYGVWLGHQSSSPFKGDNIIIISPIIIKIIFIILLMAHIVAIVQVLPRRTFEGHEEVVDDPEVPLDWVVRVGHPLMVIELLQWSLKDPQIP